MNEYFNDCAEDLSVELESKNVEFGYFNYVTPDVRDHRGRGADEAGDQQYRQQFR